MKLDDLQKYEIYQHKSKMIVVNLDSVKRLMHKQREELAENLRVHYDAMFGLNRREPRIKQ